MFFHLGDIDVFRCLNFARRIEADTPHRREKVRKFMI